MTPEQKQIAIAEFEFWSMRQPYSGEYQIGQFTEEWNSKDGFPKELPERHSPPPYLTSRDAICGAVARLPFLLKNNFNSNLAKLVGGKVYEVANDDDLLFKFATATPAQLADALLLTLGYEI